MYLIKKNIKSLNRKRYFDKDNKKSLRLNRNERIIDLNKLDKNKILKKIEKLKIGLYPDLNNLYKKISKYLKLSSDNIFITDGLDGAIRSMFFCYTDSKSEVIFLYPTYAMYKVYAKMFNVKYKLLNYEKDYKLKIKKIYNLISNKTSIIFFPSPNMPIEGIYEEKDFLDLIKFCQKRKILIFIDEVYYPFGERTYLNEILRNNNLIIARSFSKACGLAGARIGYLISNKNNINYISNSRSGYETNSLSVIFAETILDNNSIVKDYVNETKKGIKILKKKLEELGLEYHGGNYGNYVYVNFKNKKIVNKISKYLADKKILIRSGWEKPWDTGISISCAPPKIMNIFTKKFEKVYKKIVE